MFVAIAMFFSGVSIGISISSIYITCKAAKDVRKLKEWEEYL